MVNGERVEETTIEIWFREESHEMWTLYDLPDNRQQAEQIVQAQRAAHPDRKYEVREFPKWINTDVW